MAADSKRLPLAATRVRTAWPSAPDQPPSDILTNPADIEAEITSYFEALIHGRHMASEATDGPPSPLGWPWSPFSPMWMMWTLLANLRRTCYWPTSSAANLKQCPGPL